MPSEWLKMNLGDVASNISRPFDLKDKKEAIFLNTGDVEIGSFLHRDYSPVKGMPGQAKKALKEGDILFSEIRPANGRYAFVSFDAEDYVVSTKFMVVRPKDEALLFPEFLYLVLTQEENLHYCQLIAESRSGTFPQVTFDSIDNIPIPIPPIKIQKKLVEFKRSFDDKIELNRRMNRTLEALARALFKSWFVDFDPVRAKMRGEQPEGMDAETATLFPDELVEVDGREVPKGWEWRPFDAKLVIYGGGTPKTANPDFWGGEIPWYSVVDVPSDGDIWVNSTEKTITEAGLNGSSTRLLPVGTTIISARGTVGKLALTAVPMTMNQSCYGLFPQDGSSINFVYFSTLAAVDELKRRTHGAVFDTITRDTLQSINLSHPAPELLAAFERESGQLTKMILNNVRESAHLASLRDALLPRLLAGEIDVWEWEETP